MEIHFFVHVRRVEFQSIYARRQKISRPGEGQYFVVFILFYFNFFFILIYLFFIRDSSE